MESFDLSSIDFTRAGYVEQTSRAINQEDRNKLDLTLQAYPKQAMLILGLYFMNYWAESVKNRNTGILALALREVIRHCELDNFSESLALDFIYSSVGRLREFKDGPFIDNFLREPITELIPRLDQESQRKNATIQIKSFVYAFSCVLRMTEFISSESLKCIENIYLNKNSPETLKLYARSFFLEDFTPLVMTKIIKVKLKPHRDIFRGLQYISENEFESVEAPDKGRIYNIVFYIHKKGFVDANNFLDYNKIFRD